MGDNTFLLKIKADVKEAQLYQQALEAAAAANAEYGQSVSNVAKQTQVSFLDKQIKVGKELKDATIITTKSLTDQGNQITSISREIDGVVTQLSTKFTSLSEIKPFAHIASDTGRASAVAKTFGVDLGNITHITEKVTAKQDELGNVFTTTTAKVKNSLGGLFNVAYKTSKDGITPLSASLERSVGTVNLSASSIKNLNSALNQVDPTWERKGIEA